VRRLSLLIVVAAVAYAPKMPGAQTPTAIFGAGGSGGASGIPYAFGITSFFYPSEAPAPVSSSNPSVAQDPLGDTYVAMMSGSEVWVGVLLNTLQWNNGGFVQAGRVFPPSAATSIGAYAAGSVIVARDSSGGIWWNTFALPATFGGWRNLGGVFHSTDPIVGVVPGSNPVSFYIVCRDDSNSIWSGYWNGTSFGGWQHGGAQAAGSTISMTVGSDNAAYVAILDSSNSVWMAQVQQNAFGTWFSGGGNFSTAPSVAASNGGIYVAAADSGNGVWTAAFAQGSTNGWGAWAPLGGRLLSPQIKADPPTFAVAGMDGAGSLWWYNDNTATWKFVSVPSPSTAAVAVAPR